MKKNKKGLLVSTLIFSSVFSQAFISNADSLNVQTETLTEKSVTENATNETNTYGDITLQNAENGEKNTKELTLPQTSDTLNSETQSIEKTEELKQTDEVEDTQTKLDTEVKTEETSHESKKTVTPATNESLNLATNESFSIKDTGETLSNQKELDFNEKTSLKSEEKPKVLKRSRRSFTFNPDSEIVKKVIENDVYIEHYKDNSRALRKNEWVSIGRYNFYTDSTGKIVKGPKQIDGKLFVFDREGKKIVDSNVIVDGVYYEVDKMGIAKIHKNRWVSVGKKDYYTDETGRVLNGIHTIRNDKYYFNADGLQKNYKNIENSLYFETDQRGVLLDVKKGWKDLNGNRYYTYDGGKIYDGYRNIDGKYYFFRNIKGALRNDLVLFKGTMFKASDDYTLSKVTDSWVNYRNNRYRTDKNAKVLKGARVVNGVKYYFNYHGLVKNAKLIDKLQYIQTDKEGRMLEINKGWKNIGPRKYYTYKGGKIYDGFRNIGGKYYFFKNKNGAIQNDKVLFKGIMYQAGNDYVLTKLVNSWVDYKNNTLRTDQNGKSLVGLHNVDGVKYYFNQNGLYKNAKLVDKLQYIETDNKGVLKYIPKGWKNLNGNRYYTYEGGKIYDGFRNIDGKYYFFNANYGALRNTKLIHQDICYFVDNDYTLRKAASQWFNHNNNDYRTDQNAKIFLGTHFVDGHWYHFTRNGLKKNFSEKRDNAIIVFNENGLGKEIATTQKPVESSVGQISKTYLDKMVKWFRDHQGKVTYSMHWKERVSEKAADCSSAVFRSMINAGILPKDQWIGNTETLFKMGMEGKVLKEVKESEIKYGDIFVAGRQGASTGSAGHTGVILSKDRIIHCTYSLNGIGETPRKHWMGDDFLPVKYFRLVSIKK